MALHETSRHHAVLYQCKHCIHSANAWPQSCTVGHQWDTPPVKIAPVATSKSAICPSFCPHYKQRTGQGRINIVTDLGDNSTPDISKQRVSHLLIKLLALRMRGPSRGTLFPTLWTLAVIPRWQTAAQYKSPRQSSWSVRAIISPEVLFFLAEWRHFLWRTTWPKQKERTVFSRLAKQH